MKINKKIILGLMSLTLCLSSWALLQHASAASSPFTMNFSSQDVITGKYLGVTFTLNVDTTTKADPSWTYNLIGKTSSVCKMKLLVSGVIAQNQSGTGTLQASYKKSSSSSNCDATYSGQQGIGDTSGKPAPKNTIDWTSANGVLNADGSQIEVTFSDNTNLAFIDANPAANPANQTHNFKPQDVGPFGGSTVANWCTGTAFTKISSSDNKHGINLGSYTDKSGSVNVCYNNGSTQINQPTINPPGPPITIHIDTSAYTAKQSASGAPDNSCASKFNSGFEWVMCPVLDIADSVAGAFNKFIENQMCFNTGSTSSTGGVVCNGQNNLTDSVHRAWTVFRNIATALLVIAMLAMILSQAIGGGPFDAYTVRKMLPKIVAAVIIMQLSWVLFKWAIDLSNDAGIAIRDLMYAPFGGGDKLQLDQIVGTNLGTNTTGSNDIFAFFGVLAGGVGLLALSIPGLALLAFYAVMALLTAFIVLIFRKLLIILLIIVAPLALIAWILPGTDRYWKLWKDNFTKLLLMFPMIMGLIAAGRIFASITAGNSASMFSHPILGVAHLGSLPVPYVASISGYIDLAIIVVAYFGPYFLLPQTYKWGGAAMGAAAKGIQKGVERAGKPGKDYLDWRKGLTPWKQARAARRSETERRVKHGFYEGLNSEGTMGRFRRARLGGVGTRGAERSLRGRIVENAQSEIDKHVREEDQRAIIDLTRRLLPQYHANDHDNIREAILQRRQIMVHLPGEDATLPPTHEFDGAAYGSDQHRLRAAADRALIHGQRGAVDQYYTEAMASGDAGRIAEATRFKDDNADTLGRSLTHILKGYGVAVQSTAGEIAQHSGHEVESIIAEYSSRVSSATAAGNLPAAAEAQGLLDGYIARHQEALANPSLRGSVDLRGTEAVNAYTELRTAPPVLPPGVPSLDALMSMPAATRAPIIATMPVATQNAINHIIEMNTGQAARAAGRSDREANRSRYQSPGLPPDQTIPLIHPDS